MSRRDGRSLASILPGEVVVLSLPGGEEMESRVNLVAREGGEIVRVGGGLVGRAGGFSLHERAGEISGRILLTDVGIAYEVVPLGESVRIREIPLANIVCDPLPREPSAIAQAVPSDQPLPAPPLLSSRPAAAAVLYLDFDGETVVDPDWNNGNPVVAAASPLSSGQITEVWNRVKEDFWAFNIDVTTDVSRYNAAAVGRRMRCIITPTSAWYGAVGGVAYVDSFGSAGSAGFSASIPCWVFNSSISGVAEAVSHELGHTLGLRHDGDLTQPSGSTGRAYYGGHGSGAVSWGPIMGASYTRSLVQWSSGEYLGANNQEDDIALITRPANGFGFVSDEAGNTRATAAALAVTGGAITQVGVISSSADVDFYAFSLTAVADLSISANPAAVSPNLDISLELQSAAGATLASSNPDLALSADLSLSLSPGTYYVRVQGTGRGAVQGTGYSSYGSIGHYSLTGSFGAAISPTISAQPSDRSVLVGSSTTFSVVVSGSAPLTYQWRKDGVNLQNIGRVTGATSSNLSLTGAIPDDAGNYSVVITNLVGTVTSAAATLSVNIPGPPTIVTQPTVGFTMFGSPTHLVVEAAGEGNLSYQWYRNGAAIAGATSAALDIPSLGVAELGNYYVVVANGSEPVTSRVARINFSSSGGVPASFWLDAAESGGVVYFLFASPARVLRYDLATETWLPAVNLGFTPSCFAVANDAVYIGTGFRVARFDRNVSNETTLTTVPLAVTGVVVAGENVVVATPDPFSSTYVQLASFRRSSGLKVGEKSAGYAGIGFSYSAEAGRLYWRSTSVSPSDIMTAEIDANGSFGTTFDSPYHGSYPSGVRTMVLGNGALVTDTAGVVFRAADLRYAGSFAGAIDDVAPLPNGEGHVLRGATVSAYDGKLRRTADLQLSRYAFRMWRTASGLVAFAHPATSGGTPSVEKVTPAQWRPLRPALPVEAMGRRVTPTRMVLDENAVLYVYSAGHQNIFRWSTADRRYLPPIPLVDPANYLAYSAENRALYTDDGASTVRQIALDSASLLERPFASASQALTGLQTAGSTVFFTDPSGAWHTHYTFTPAGDMISAVEWNYQSREFTWSPETRRMFFLRENISPSDLHYESIAASGKIDGSGQTPYHSSEGIVPPIRVSPGGSSVLLGSGRIYDGTQLTLTANLGTTLLDAAWESGAIHVLTGTAAGASRVDTFSPTTFQSLRNVTFVGAPLRLFSLGSGRLLLVTDIGGYLDYRVLLGATLGLVTEDTTSAAPAASAPQFIAPPLAQTTVVGGSVVFSAVVFGQAPLQYQWRRGTVALANGAKVAGATTATLVLTDVQAADLGSFDLVVTNTLGSATSSAASLTFAVAPLITSPPAGADIGLGDAVSFTVSHTGTAPVSYQWKRNGVPVLDSATVTGAATATLTLTHVPAAAAGNYTVTITNLAGTVTSVAAALSVFVPTPPAIAIQPQGATANFGQDATLGVVVTGTPPFSYQWRRNGLDLGGATSRTLALTNLQASDAGNYTVHVSNTAGFVISSVAVLTVLVPPGIVLAPTDQIVLPQAAAQFSVGTSGTVLTYRWQRRSASAADWIDLSDSSLVSGAGTEILTLTTVTPAMTGDQFRCVVSNVLGSVTSPPAALTVAAPSAVVGVFASGWHSKILRADGTLWAMGSNSGGQLGDGTTVNRPRPVYIAGNVTTAALGYWHSLFIRTDRSLWAMGTNGGRLGDGTLVNRPTPVLVATDVTQVGGGEGHSAFVKTNGSLWTMGSNDYGQLGDGTTTGRPSPAQIATGVAQVALSETHSLFISTAGAIWGMGGDDWGQLADGQATTIRRKTPVQSLVSGVTRVATGYGHTLFLKTDGSLWAVGNNLSGQLGDGTLTNRATPISVTATAVAVAAGASHSLFIKPDRSLWAMGFNSYGQLGDGTTINRLTPVQVATDVVAVAAGYYFSLFVKADGSVWSMGDNVVGQLGDGTTIQRNSPTRILSGVPPIIGTHPQGQSVNVGQNVVLSVTASGPSPFNYQWRKGGVVLAGATAASLTITGVQAADAGIYDVVVTNPAGSTVSNAAALTVVVPVVAPTIALQPVSQTVSIGMNASFAVSAGGTAPLTYQWRKGGAALSGATSAGLTVHDVQTTDGGSYDVVVTNAVGFATSTGAMLTVSPVPAVITAPQSQTIHLGADVTFSVEPAGLAPFTFQWKKNGEAIVGATGATLTLNRVSASATGRYAVVITNGSGAVTSNAAVLLVQVVGAQASGTQSLLGAGYHAGGTVTISNTITYSETLTGLGWQALLPDGWTFVATNSGGVPPTAGEASVLEWVWSTSVPSSPFTFTYTLQVPPGANGAQAIAALVLPQQNGTPFQLLVTPDPLTIEEVTFHSADTDGDRALDLFELTRVIELYNTRHGTIRTGAYRVDAANFEDGFAANPARGASASAVLTRYHSADTRGATTGSLRDGAIDLFELTRVIELYNTRAGTVRTGRYHLQSGTEDGFAAGP